MRNRALTAGSFCVLLISALLSVGAASPQALGDHGGPDSDPSPDFDLPYDVDTADGLDKSLVPLEALIEPEELARLDAHRDAYSHGLQRMLAEGARGPGVDLRYRDTRVKKQIGGTCSAHGLMSAMENLMGGDVELSERHFWSQYHKYSSTVAIRTASKGWGVVELEWWPNASCFPRKGYLEQAWYSLAKFEPLEGDLVKAIYSLNAGNPVYFAFSTPWDMVVNKPAHVSPDSGHYKKSGHAVSIVGYQLDPAIPGGGEFLIKNSWGTKAGDQGYQWYPFNLCTKKGMYCTFWSIQDVKHD